MYVRVNGILNYLRVQSSAPNHKSSREKRRPVSFALRKKESWKFILFTFSTQKAEPFGNPDFVPESLHLNVAASFIYRHVRHRQTQIN